MKSPPTISRYMLDGVVYSVDAQAKLGAGSEGTVVAHARDPRLCIKLFHPADQADAVGMRVAAYRGKKVSSICGAGLALPSQFTMPLRPVFDEMGRHVIGYAMMRVPSDRHKLLKLLDATFRADHQIGLGEVSRLFADLFDDLALIHPAGLVIGDVNLGCLMFQPGGERSWVDTDSWSYPGYPCLATTELFAHPDLYPNLTPGGKVVPSLPRHDQFALLVAFCMLAIPGAHPFRAGLHPRVEGLQERTMAGITIFDPDVTVPAMLGTFDVLSDELLHELIQRLKRRIDVPLSSAMLREFADGVTRCYSCQSSYHASRSHCPKCQEITRVQVPGLAAFAVEEFFRPEGTLLFAQMIGRDLYTVSRHNGRIEIYRVDEFGAGVKLSPGLNYPPGTRFRFFADSLVVCPAPSGAAPVSLELYRIEGNNLRRLAGTSTGVLEGGGAVFDTSERFLYRTAANALMYSELFGVQGALADTQVATVYQRQSWFTADRTADTQREVIFGYDRALRTWQWFVAHGNTLGGRFKYYDVDDLGLRAGETVEDFFPYFSASSVLLVMQTSFNGRDFVRFAIIGLDGKVHVNRTLDESHSTYDYWSVLRGKLHQGKSVLHVTPEGIVKENIVSGEIKLLTGTAGQVSADDRLIRMNGQVGIVGPRGVRCLKSNR